MTGLDATNQRPLDRWYLAGPFFNPAQVELIRSIELAFCDNGVPCFSPRGAPENKKKGPLTNEDASNIFASNIDNLLDVKCVLAVLDWKLPAGQEVRVIRKHISYTERHTIKETDPVSVHIESGKLELPDTGTVFEMGAFFMQWLFLHRMANSGFPSSGGKPRLVGFTDNPNGKLNIMLTQACCGVIHGLEELNKFLNKGDIQWHLAKPWTGKNQ